IDITFPVQIRGKKTDIESIFLNLFINSLYSLKEKYHLKKFHPTIEIRAIEEENQIILFIKDNGMGIEQENMKKIFDPFFTTKPAGIGTGLGLSIIKVMVEGLGGTVEFNSQYMDYCEFVFSFPNSAK